MYKYSHFIPKNIAPVGAQSIGVFNSTGVKVYDIPLGRLAPPTESKLYSFCAVSDVHITYDTANEDFQRALTYAETHCDFTCISGDLTSTGSQSEMAIYKNTIDAYAPTKPVYGIAGKPRTLRQYKSKLLGNVCRTPIILFFYRLGMTCSL